MLTERKAVLPRGALFVNEWKCLQQKIYTKIHANDKAFLVTRV